MPNDADITALLGRAARPEPLSEAVALSELEQRLFGREAAPIRLSRYLLLEPLGAGGAGVVFAAYDPELDRKVAIKLLRSEGLDDSTRAANQARLLREAQTLASVAHPNVIAVHDVGTYAAGSFADGVPELGDSDAHPGVFVVMELVDGFTMRQWLDLRERSVEEVLGAFVAAGRGLSAAHAAGLVHRDFKPTNVLVGSDGRVRVLDFGLAVRHTPVDRTAGPRPVSARTTDAAIEIRPTSDAPITEEGIVVGTPPYMSPEQHCGGEVGPRSDQFSFCVALWEALHGERPFRSPTLQGMLDAKVNGVASERPTARPVPSRIHQALLVGLEPHPDDRHPSMKELLAALNLEPRRRWRRTALWLSATGASVIGAAAYGFSAGESQVCDDASSSLAGAWDDEIRERLKSRFGSSDNASVVQVWPRVEQGLDDHAHAWTKAWSAACTDAISTGSTAVLSGRLLCLERDRRRMGAVVRALSEADDFVLARAPEQVLELSEADACADAAPSSPSSAEREAILEIEEDIARARLFLQADRSSEAIEPALQAVEAARRVGDSRILVDALRALGAAQQAVGHFEQAERTAASALEHAEAADDVNSAVRAAAGLIRVLSDIGRYDAADGMVIATRPRMIRHDVTDTSRVDLLFQIANLRLAQQRPEDAIDVLERALELVRSRYPAGHPAIARFRNILGNAFKDAGRYDEARVELTAAHESMLRALGEHSYSVGLVLNNLGNVAIRTGKVEEARDLYRRSRRVLRELFPDGHRTAVVADANLGALEVEFGDPSVGVEDLTFAIDVIERVTQSDTDELIWLKSTRGRGRLVLGRPIVAHADLEAVYEASVRLHGFREGKTLWSALELADSEIALGCTAAASRRIDETIGLLESSSGDADILVRAISAQGALQEARGNDTAALAARSRALELARNAPDADPVSIAWAQMAVARSALRTGQAQDAMTRLSAAVDRLEQEVDDSRLALALADLAVAQEATGATREARGSIERALTGVARLNAEPIVAAPVHAAAAELLESSGATAASEHACTALAGFATTPFVEADELRLHAWINAHGVDCPNPHDSGDPRDEYRCTH